jgi:hypothetical protein
MTDEELQALRAVVDYNWDDEERDYADHTEDGDLHIFKSLKTLDLYLRAHGK